MQYLKHMQKVAGLAFVLAAKIEEGRAVLYLKETEAMCNKVRDVSKVCYTFGNSKKIIWPCR
jgi:hypothetical protein